MSQSPSKATETDKASSYRLGWSAINRLIHEGKSFSGKERNTVFLNLEGKSFSDVSGISGFNYQDDSRAIVSCDWDFDGDRDLWISSRTSPRIRFLINQSERSSADSDYVNIWLKGKGNVNKDAIGARVNLFLKGDSRPLTRLLQAGDAFLSQDSHWLHFPIPSKKEIDHLKVFWPAGQSQDIKSIQKNKFYVIETGESPVIYSPPTGRKRLKISNQLPNPDQSKSRIVLNSRLPLPPIYLIDENQEKEASPDQLKGPLLINLWTTWCGPCREELVSIIRYKHKLESVGLKVLALNAEAEKASLASKILNKINWPFSLGNASAQTVLNLDLFHRAILDLWTSIPVPSSFLIDENGEVAVIYKGPVDPDRIIQDMDLLSLHSLDLREKATPFNGRWVSTPKAASPLWINSQFVAHDQVHEGIKYLSKFIEIKRQNKTLSPKFLSNLYYSVGSLQAGEGLISEAEISFRKAIHITQRDHRIYLKLGQLLSENQDGSIEKLNEGIGFILKANQLNPKNTQIKSSYSKAMIQKADLLLKKGETALVIKTYKDLMRAVPSSTEAAEKLAWILLTTKDDNYRNTEDAYGIALHLCNLTNYRNPTYLDLLSVAEAYLGRFESALKHAQRAAILHRRSGNGSEEQESIIRIRYFKGRKTPINPR